jgi:hypothetical protein
VEPPFADVLDSDNTGLVWSLLPTSTGVPRWLVLTAGAAAIVTAGVIWWVWPAITGADKAAYVKNNESLRTQYRPLGGRLPAR